MLKIDQHNCVNNCEAFTVIVTAAVIINKSEKEAIIHVFSGKCYKCL